MAIRCTFAIEPCQGKRHADLVYSGAFKKDKEAYILFHMEAQSTPEDTMAVRIWEYHTAIARAHFSKSKKKVPLILSFVFYNGKTPWRGPISIAELFDDFETYVALSLRTPFVIDVTTMERAKMIDKGAAAPVLMIMQGRATGDHCSNLKTLYPLLKKHRQLNEENIEYIAITDHRNEAVVVEKVNKFGKDFIGIMFAAIREKSRRLGLEEGRQEGIQEGMQRGMQEGRHEGRQEGIQEAIAAIRLCSQRGQLDAQQAKLLAQELETKKP